MFRTAFGGIEWFLIAYFVCLAGFFVIGKERLSLGFLYPFLFMLLTIFNPFFIVPLAAKIGLTTRIRRLFWLLPVNLVLAYAFTMLCTLRMKKWAQLLLSIVFAVFIATVGSSGCHSGRRGPAGADGDLMRSHLRSVSHRPGQCSSQADRCGAGYHGSTDRTVEAPAAAGKRHPV